MGEDYIPRVIDNELKFKLDTFGAVNITGPKWCGKSKTAEMHSKSALYLQSYSDINALKLLSESNPDILLEGDKPRLIDEWQDAPALWDRIRFNCDHSDGPGQYILTGSTSKKVKTLHTGTGRISELRMYPMSLFETGESNGSVSLRSLFDKTDMKIGCRSDLTVDRLSFACCRGGWPYCSKLKSDRSKLAVAKDYYHQIHTVDMFNVDSVKRNGVLMEGILKTYSRNLSTLAKKTSLIKDLSSPVSDLKFPSFLAIACSCYVL